MEENFVVGKLDPEENVLQWFEQTSNEIYNRHDYKLVYTNGKNKVFENHQEFMAAWFQYPKQLLSHGEVLDKKIKKKTKSGGFM
jgi:hypothetical protein